MSGNAKQRRVARRARERALASMSEAARKAVLGFARMRAAWLELWPEARRFFRAGARLSLGPVRVHVRGPDGAPVEVDTTRAELATLAWKEGRR